MWLLKALRNIFSERQPLDLGSTAAAVNVLAENPAYQYAREEILRDIVEKWLGSPPDAKDERERLYLQAHALSQLDTQFGVILARNAMKAKTDV